MYPTEDPKKGERACLVGRKVAPAPFEGAMLCEKSRSMAEIGREKNYYVPGFLEDRGQRLRASSQSEKEVRMQDHISTTMKS